MDFSKIEKWSWGYQLLRYYVKFAHNVFFYKKVCVTGWENIPKDKPVFFAPNHQNALMDALIILFSVKKQPVFVARSDIFKNPIIAKILIFFKILPAYRIRDGKENLKKNKELFNTSVRVLESHTYQTLFPETTHIDKRRLRPLKKGIQRIVFQTEEANDFRLDIQIVPVGIYYSNYWNFRSTIQINFGKAIPVSQFKELYKENPQKAMLALRDEMSKGIIDVMLHIKSEEYYDMYELLREMYDTYMLEKLNLPYIQKNKFKADKKLIDALDKELENNPENIKKLNKKVSEYAKYLKKYNIRDWVLRKNESFIGVLLKSLLLILSLPVFLYGALNNIIPYLLPYPLISKLEDRQFTSSISFAFGLVFFPLFYLIQTLIFHHFIQPGWLSWLYLLSLPITGLLAFGIHRLFVKTRAQWVYLINKNKSGFKRIINLRKEIIKITDKIVEKNL